MDSVDVNNLSVNKSSITDKQLESCKTEGTKRQWPKSPFKIDHDINCRVVLYDGDVDLLTAEAIVNPTNENLTQLNYVNKLAGPELETYVRKKVKNCATGDVRLTPGFKSNFKYIIHAVPPKYQPKYKTAAETALFHTYFRVLEAMIEKKIRTIVMPTITTSKCNLPPEENCHLQLRIIRRMLEKKRHEFDRIVIHTQDIELYAKLFFCYFPRTLTDEEFACYELTNSLGGPNGEPLIPEREIRIKSKPAVLGANDNSIDLTSGLDLSTVVGNTPFSKMREDLDKKFTNLAKSNSSRANTGGASSQVAIRKPAFRGCNLL